MRVSEYFKLGRTQPSLDFVDVDITNDTRLFIDPKAISDLGSDWGQECSYIIQEFFKHILELIRAKKHSRARSLLRMLREPNETHLGLSTGRSMGRGLGRESANNVWDSLTTSEAIKSGLLKDLEDTILMIPGISSDLISDMTTNLIRKQLIEYTQKQAKYHLIPLENDVDSGPLWNPIKKEWYSEFVKLPKTTSGLLLLVPKIIVRKQLAYDVDTYYNHYILDYLRDAEIKAGSDLVHLLRNGKIRVTKNDLKKKYGTGKTAVVEITKRHPEILGQYRNDLKNSKQPALSHNDIGVGIGSSVPDWNEILGSVKDIPAGKKHAHLYEKAIEILLTAIFYPSLSDPKVQVKLHQGRKRVDITYANTADNGFFFWLGQHYKAGHVFVECKNYTADIANPELDQLSGRFSPKRGKFGLLICRKLEDKELFIKRCIDTANDKRGFIIVLDDEDLEILIEERKNVMGNTKFAHLKDRFDELIM